MSGDIDMASNDLTNVGTITAAVYVGLPAAQYTTYWQSLNENVNKTLLDTKDQFELLDDTPVFTATPATYFNPLVGSTSRLEYIGPGTGNFGINWSLSVQLAGGDKEGEIRMFLNGVAVIQTAVDHHFSKDRSSTASGSVILALSAGDILDIRVKNKEDTEGVFIRTFAMTLIQFF
jgi:hypothetical protein